MIQSLHRTAQLPPTDPWFAGEPIWYYYGGHLLIATLAEVTNTPGRFAYNPGKAVVFGTLLTAAYGVGKAIVASRDLPVRTAGAMGVFFVGFASNFHTPIWALLTVLPNSIDPSLVRAMHMDPALLAGPGSFSTIQGVHFSYTNTDFPVYTLFIGGVHPDNLSPPFTLLLVRGDFSMPIETTTRRFFLLGLTTPLVGLIAVINTWSVPMAPCGLIALTVSLAPAQPRFLLIPLSDSIASARARTGFPDCSAASSLASLPSAWGRYGFARTSSVASPVTPRSG